jgi:hypothetical protein
MTHWHNILGISPTSTREEIMKAYRKKALEFHPDVNKSAEAVSKFKEINDAFRVLTDPGYRPYRPPKVKPKPKPRPSKFDLWDNPTETFKDSMAGQYFGDRPKEKPEVFVDSMSGNYESGDEFIPKPIRTWKPPKEVDLWKGKKDPVEVFWKEYERLKSSMAYEDSSEFWKKLDEYMKKNKS